MTLPACQSQTAALLRRLAGSDPVETPISAVFIGADTVWKLRKAVHLSFLDFTSLAERERTARREFELNAPNAPGMYQAVLPITQSPDGAELNDQGEVIDWVVQMARVPAADFLDAIAARGDLTPTLLDRLADTIAALHARLAPVDIDAVAAMRRIIEGNHQASLAAGLTALRMDAWRCAMLAALDQRADWLAARTRQGFIRRAHGDLHLGNLCLWQGQPVAFDALEFDEALATIDLGYDLAFLLMDLDLRASTSAANRVMNRYIARTGDAGLLAGLPMFLSMRAVVRAHVAANGGKPWQDYLAYAEAALRPAKPIVIGIGGLPGTGKSTLARAIAPHLGPKPGAVVLRSDEIRKRLHGAVPEQHLPQEAYSEAASRTVMAEIFAEIATAVHSGHAVIADMTFMNPADRLALAHAATPAPCLGVWLHAPLNVLEARISARTGDASDADLAFLHRAVQADPGAGDWAALDATDDQLVQQLTKLVTHAASTC